MSRQIRMIQPADIPAVRDIYAPYVAETSVSFEYERPHWKSSRPASNERSNGTRGWFVRRTGRS